MNRAMMATVVVAALALAGCASESPAGEAGTNAAGGARGGRIAFEEVPEVDAGAAPHVHDYWAGRERVTLVDRDYEVTPEEAVQWGMISTIILRDPFLGAQEVNLPEGALVYEGAGRLEVTTTWQDPTISGLRFLHKHAGSSDIQPWIDAPNGETVRIELTPQMTDMPHAQVSRWAFLFAASGPAPSLIGTFHVKMDVVKSRDVGEWPGHPDLWGDATTRIVADADGSSRSTLGPVGFLQRDDPWGTPPDAIPATATVPMETASLVVTVTVLGVEPADMQVDRLRLLVRTAADLEFDFHDVDGGNASDDRRTWTWNMPVRMDQADNPYAEESAWAFRVTAAYATALGSCGEGCADAELRYHITAAAHRTPADVPEES